MQWDGREIKGWYRGRFYPDLPNGPDWRLSVPNGIERDDDISPDGDLLTACVGDYICTVSSDGVVLERSVYPPDLFAALHEPVAE